MAGFYIHRNFGNKVFVKEQCFAEKQGILKQPWGKKWLFVQADSIQHARQIGESLLPQFSLTEGT